MIKPKAPLTLERQYQRELRLILAQSKTIIEEEVIRNLPYIVNESTKYDSVERKDDIASKIMAMFLIAQGRIDLLITGLAVDRMVQHVASLINNFNKLQFERIIKSKVGEFKIGNPAQVSEKLNAIRNNPNLTPEQKVSLLKMRNQGPLNIPQVSSPQSGTIPSPIPAARAERQAVYKLLQTTIGVDPLKDNPKLAETMNIWVTNNVNLIKSNNTQFLEQAQSVVLNGVQNGVRHETIATQILNGTDLEKGRFKTAETRAAIIARDQVNKLNGVLNQIRQTETGITKYRWRGVMDARERFKHRMLENKVFEWDKGPALLNGAHPGQEILCRCWAEPEIDIDDILANL